MTSGMIGLGFALSFAFGWSFSAVMTNIKKERRRKENGMWIELP